MTANQAVRIKIHAGVASSGRPVHEELPASRVPGPGRCYQLEVSPALAQGVAAGDVISLDDDGSFEVVERSGNLCVQVYSEGPFDGRTVAEFVERVVAIGGRHDGQDARVIVFSIPVTIGFVLIQETLDELVSGVVGVSWYYGNVYDPSDGTAPLNWW